MKSNKFSLTWQDAGKALALTIITAFLSALWQSLEVSFNTGDWAHVIPTKPQISNAGFIALNAGAGYIIKNFFSDTVKSAEKTLEIAGVTPPCSDKPTDTDTKPVTNQSL